LWKSFWEKVLDFPVRLTVDSFKDEFKMFKVTGNDRVLKNDNMFMIPCESVLPNKLEPTIMDVFFDCLNDWQIKLLPAIRLLIVL